MKAFGIELRKQSAGNVFKDVDLVLANKSLQTVQALSVAHALQKMMGAGSFFDVCTINACQKICQVHIPGEHMDIYSAIHCVRWNDMLPEYRTHIIALVLNDFRSVLNPLQQC